MRDENALHIIAMLATTTNGWDDASVEQWTQRLTELPHPGVAWEAAEELIRTWTFGNRPTWGRFRELYDARVPPPLALPARTYGGVSIGQHLVTLQASAAGGSKEAAAELATWRKHLARSDTWLRYMESA